MRKRKSGFGVYVCAGFLGIRQFAQAIEPNQLLLFNWDPVTIKPQIGLTEVYDDNLFYQPRDQTSDLTTILSPGLGVMLGKRAANYLILNYLFNEYLHVNRTDLDTSESILELNSYYNNERVELRGIDRIQFLSSPVGGETKVLDPQAVDRPFNVAEANIDRLAWYDAYTFSYKPTAKTSAYLQGLHSSIDYEEGVRLFDITTYAGTLGFGFQGFPKTVFFGETYYGITSSEPNLPGSKFPDITFVGGALGARGSFTPKLTGLIRVGYEARDSKSDASIPGAPVVNLGLAYQYSEKTSISLNYVRRQDVSIYFEQQSYTSDAVSLQASQALGAKGKWKATAGGYYSLYDYSRTLHLPARSYDVYSAYFNLAYQIQLWLTASLGYERTSVIGGSADIAAYDVNRITLRLSIGY